ncbi:hypothetical protein ACGF3G_00600 [Streptomyces sp. NPDC048179]|uniref:hypothetical protein n=1 Tax=Streptomyces sp. NPDC048179 TaxID=3365506 RepID=UPI00371EAB8C
MEAQATTKVTTQRAGRGRLDVLVSGVRKGYVVSYLGAHRAFDTDGRLIEDYNRGFLGWGYDLRREAVAAVAAH